VDDVAEEQEARRRLVIIAVTGGRSYSDQAKVDAVLDAIWDQCNCKLTVVHGGAPGADACANAWVMAKRAHGANVRKVVHYAEWGNSGRPRGRSATARC
jgi:Protein of unknown function (DUF2493).